MPVTAAAIAAAGGVVVVILPLGSVCHIVGNGISHSGSPAGESISAAGRCAIESGGRVAPLNTLHLIRKRCAAYTVRIGNNIICFLRHGFARYFENYGHTCSNLPLIVSTVILQRHGLVALARCKGMVSAGYVSIIFLNVLFRLYGNFAGIALFLITAHLTDIIAAFYGVVSLFRVFRISISNTLHLYFVYQIENYTFPGFIGYSGFNGFALNGESNRQFTLGVAPLIIRGVPIKSYRVVFGPYKRMP